MLLESRREFSVSVDLSERELSHICEFLVVFLIPAGKTGLSEKSQGSCL